MISIKNILIGIAIVILTSFVVIYGVQTFYPGPEYEDFCEAGREPIPEKIDEGLVGGTCATVSPDSRDECCINRGYEEYEEDTGRCIGNACYNKYEEAREPYSRNLFIITTIIGLILLGIGVYLFKLEAVGAGIMGGGIVTLIYGSGQYWRYSGDAFKFIISLVGLIIVIFLAYHFNKKK